MCVCVVVVRVCVYPVVVVRVCVSSEVLCGVKWGWANEFKDFKHKHNSHMLITIVPLHHVILNELSTRLTARQTRKQKQQKMAHLSYKVLVWSHVKVIEEVAKDPNSLSDALFQNGIIAQGIRDEIQLDCIGDTQKVQILATCLEDIIKVFPHRYEDIIEILRENFGYLVVALKNKEEEILLAGGK